MLNKFLSQGLTFSLRGHILWFNIIGSGVCKIKHFIQNKSQASKKSIRGLDEENKTGQSSSKSSLNIQSLKKKQWMHF